MRPMRIDYANQAIVRMKYMSKWQQDSKILSAFIAALVLRNQCEFAIKFVIS